MGIKVTEAFGPKWMQARLGAADHGMERLSGVYTGAISAGHRFMESGAASFPKRNAVCFIRPQPRGPRRRGGKAMKIQESAENYLEAILMLKQEKGLVRSIDIAHHMAFSKPSVSRAMSLLRENGYITMERDGGWIELTPSGKAIAERIYERHRLLTSWLIRLGVSPEVAAEDACRMEHDVSLETFEKLKAHIQKSGGKLDADTE